MNRSARAVTPLLAFIAFALFVAICACFGGSARGDVIYLLALRPASILLLALFLVIATRDQLRPLNNPLLLLAALALTMVLQLIAFTAMPWGDPSGLSQQQLFENRLSISPDRTWNSLISLILPLTALIGFAALGEARGRAIPILLVMVVASAVFGVFNLMAGEQGSFSIYEQFNRGTPNGFLANRNHQAALLAAALPLLRVWSLTPHSGRGRGVPRVPIALAAALFFALLILMSGSRGGVILLGIALLASIAIRPQRLDTGLPKWANRSLLAAGALAIAGIIALTLMLGRAPSLDRLMGANQGGGELRLSNLPAMLTLLREGLPFGTGYGAFDPAFRVVEADAMLRPSYFNNAHNDLLELAITGGIPALIVLGAFVVWWGWSSFQVFRRRGAGGDVYRARAGSVGILVLLLASLIDYPLRTPLLAVVFALFSGLLAVGAAGVQHVATRRGGD